MAHLGLVLCDVCFLCRGDVQSWIKEVQQYLPSIEGLISISIVDLILRHIEFLDQLLCALRCPVDVQIYFTPTFIYDDNVFGKVK